MANILVSRRSSEERRKNHIVAINKQIQQYIKNGSEGDLRLSYTPITSLPDNLTIVNGDLYLANTTITSLPDNLTVNGSLRMIDTLITSLPKGLIVTGVIYIENTPISENPKLVKEYKKKYKIVI